LRHAGQVRGCGWRASPSHADPPPATLREEGRATCQGSSTSRHASWSWSSPPALVGYPGLAPALVV
jgi:hypothetical protein